MKRFFSFITCWIFLWFTVNVSAEELSSNVSNSDEEIVVDTANNSLVESYDDN